MTVKDSDSRPSYGIKNEKISIIILIFISCLYPERLFHYPLILSNI